MGGAGCDVSFKCRMLMLFPIHPPKCEMFKTVSDATMEFCVWNVSG